MLETDSDKPVCDYLTGNGYTVHSEVKNCDIIARKGDELVVVEMKKSFNATLLIQAVERQQFADSVYVAIAKPVKWGEARNFKGMCHLLKRLGLGLIIVEFLKTKTRVEVVFDPADYQVKRSHKKRYAVIREAEKRTADHNQGGSTRKKIMTGYRENAIFIACCLDKYGSLSPKALREIGTGSKTASLLQKNYYGWYERVTKGLYGLTEKGQTGLKEFREVAHYYRLQLEQHDSTGEKTDC